MLIMSYKRNGFSLVELMVTLAVIGILLALAAPYFSDWAANSRVRSTAEALQNALRKAQSEAIRRNHQTALVLTAATAPSATSTANTAGPNWFIRLVNFSATETATSATADGGSANFLIASETYGSSNSVTIVGSKSMICFNSLGRLTNNAASTSDGYALNCTVPASPSSPVTYTISRTGASLTLQVRVGLGGRVQMCYPAKPATDPDGCHS